MQAHESLSNYYSKLSINYLIITPPPPLFPLYYLSQTLHNTFFPNFHPSYYTYTTMKNKHNSLSKTKANHLALLILMLFLLSSSSCSLSFSQRKNNQVRKLLNIRAPSLHDHDLSVNGSTRPAKQFKDSKRKIPSSHWNPIQNR